MSKLIYFDISSDFGFFKKPDINKFSLTYNLPPKPAILGILGSILGMKGLNQHYDENNKLKELLETKDILEKEYNNAKKFVGKIDLDNVRECLNLLNYPNLEKLIELVNCLKSSKEKDFENNKKELHKLLKELSTELAYPEYYRKLNHLKIGITPIGKFPFNKIMNKYNSKNSYFGGAKYENVLISEQLLIKPKYRIYVYDGSDSNILAEITKRINANSPVFMPYVGKNEFIANIENCTMIENVEKINPSSMTKISSVFLKSNGVAIEEKEEMVKPLGSNTKSISVEGLPSGFIFFEQYPVGYSGNGLQYNLKLIEYIGMDVSHSKIDINSGILVKINKQIIYLF